MNEIIVGAALCGRPFFFRSVDIEERAGGRPRRTAPTDKPVTKIQFEDGARTARPG